MWSPSALRFEGFDTEEAATGAEALDQGPRPATSTCIVLDVMLPDSDGFEVCRRCGTSTSRTPVLFLTARDATADKLAGLAQGDDYVTKPFSIDELVARIRAVLRRTAPDGLPASGRLHLQRPGHRRRAPTRSGGPASPSTSPPPSSTCCLPGLRNPRQVLSKAQILDEVWDDGFDGESNIVEIYISYLRKKVDRYDPPLIHTVRRVGYTLREPRP